MANFHDFVVGLEALREDKKITITDFTKGIMSRRNYTRLLNEETEVSFSTLDKLLQKLDINLSDFIHYLTNRVISENPEELTFAMEIVSDHFKEAQKYYDKLKNKEMKTIFGDHTIPLGLLYLDLINKKINEDNAKDKAKAIFPLDEIISHPIVQDDIVCSLNIYSKICDDDQKSKIVNYAYSVIKGDKYKMLTTFYEFSLTTLYITAIDLLSKKDNINNNDKEIFEYICKDFLKFLYRSKTINYDVMFFNMLYSYNKAHNINNEIVVFYFIVCLLSYYQEEIPSNLEYEFSKDDIAIFNKYLNSSALNEYELYEGVFNNDLL